MESIKINVMQKLLKANDAIADEIRSSLKSKGIFFVNLMSSPGSGKTTLIEETVKKLGVQAYQINYLNPRPIYSLSAP